MKKFPAIEFKQKWIMPFFSHLSLTVEVEVGA